MKEKMSIIISAGIALLIIMLTTFYILGPETLKLSNLLMIFIPIMLIIGAITILWDRIKNMKAGLPS